LLLLPAALSEAEGLRHWNDNLALKAKKSKTIEIVFCSFLTKISLFFTILDIMVPLLVVEGFEIFIQLFRAKNADRVSFWFKKNNVSLHFGIFEHYYVTLGNKSADKKRPPKYNRTRNLRRHNSISNLISKNF
jgi:hypothetical protein